MRYFSVKLDQMEEERKAVSRLAEERAQKYREMIDMTNQIKMNVNEYDRGIDGQFEHIQTRYEMLRDLQELKYSKNKQKVEVNLHNILKDIQEYNKIKDKDYFVDKTDS